MKMRSLIYLLMFFLVGYSSTASAELLINPAYVYGQKESGIELFLGNAETKYSLPLGMFEKRYSTYLSGSYIYGFGKHLNVFGATGFLFDASLGGEGYKTDGDGLAFAIGLKGEYPGFNYKDAVFSWYAQILKADQDFDDDIEGDLLEITAGVILKKEIYKGIIGYAGLEYVVNSDWYSGGISAEWEDEDEDYYEDEDDDDDIFATIDVDSERKDKLGIKLGLIFPTKRCNFFIDAGLMNELSIKAGLNIPFGGPTSVSRTAPEMNQYEVSIKAAQQKLYDLGYDPGPMDGIAGERFRNALSKFQKELGLLETGTLNSATESALGLK